jgi:NAD(P)-dependent dehydrogenase (short-subunit alcohol dehydrogenase family)
MGRAQDEVAIVTGGAMGVGEADVRFLAREGARVVVTDVNREQGSAVAKAIGGEFVAHDVTDEAAWQRLIADTVQKYGGLHVLVNNAGIVEPGNVETQTAAEWRRQMAVSADGTFFCCKYAVPAMARSGGGSIVNMASIASKLVAAGLVPRATPAAAPAAHVLGDPEDIANLVLFLASDESKFVSGQEFVPDGGISTLMASFPT